MRVAILVLLSAAVGFVVTSWLRQGQSSDPVLPMLPEPVTFEPFLPPPLDLTVASTCTEAWNPLAVPGAGGVVPSWPLDDVEAQLRAYTGEVAEVELVGVDCDEDPCIAWLWWPDGCSDPALAYRWWSLEGVPAAALWTTSRTFPTPVDGSPHGTLQAVSVAPAGSAPEASAAWQNRVGQRVLSRLEETAETVRRTNDGP